MKSMIKMVSVVVQCTRYIMMVGFCLFPDTTYTVRKTMITPVCLHIRVYTYTTYTNKTMITPVYRAQKPPKADVLSARARWTLEYNQTSSNWIYSLKQRWCQGAWYWFLLIFKTKNWPHLYLQIQQEIYREAEVIIKTIKRWWQLIVRIRVKFCLFEETILLKKGYLSI